MTRAARLVSVFVRVRNVWKFCQGMDGFPLNPGHIAHISSLLQALLDAKDNAFMQARATFVQMVKNGEVSENWKPEPVQPLDQKHGLTVLHSKLDAFHALIMDISRRA